MSQIKTKLDQLEIRLQTLIEGSAARIFPEVDLQETLAHRLVSAMKERIRTDTNGSIIAPNLYILSVHPEQIKDLDEDAKLDEELAQTIESAGVEAGFKFLEPPRIQIKGDDSVPFRQVDITAKIYLGDLAQTTDISGDIEPGDLAIPENAFLIVNGTHTYNLTTTVVNLGRRPDNHLVIDDGRVSRLHAQLRVVDGRYVVFDLESTGGTFVNNQRIHQSIIFPGDVISLGGVPLVFGQDESGIGETQQYIPPAEDIL
jgi:hypothetical protein